MCLKTVIDNHIKEIKILFIGFGKFVRMYLAKENCRKNGLSKKTIDEINFSSKKSVSI
jgi:hypothetical protein